MLQQKKDYSILMETDVPLNNLNKKKIKLECKKKTKHGEVFAVSNSSTPSSESVKSP